MGEEYEGVYIVLTNNLIGEFRNCDHVVVGMPYKNEVW